MSAKTAEIMGPFFLTKEKGNLAKVALKVNLTPQRINAFINHGAEPRGATLLSIWEKYPDFPIEDVLEAGNYSDNVKSWVYGQIGKEQTTNSNKSKLPEDMEGGSYVVASDNSMEPKIKEGDHLIIRPVSKEDILYGYPHYVVTENYKLPRLIRKGKKGKILLVPLNTDSFDSIEVDIDNIRAIYLIKGVYSRFT